VPPLFRPTLLVLLLLPALAHGALSLDHARRARAMIGEETWSQIVEVENTNAESVYPASLHALVFELGGILWFYTDTDGTQSFSLHQNNLPAEKKDFAPLLRAIDPGFTKHTVLAEDELAALPAPAADAPLPNGCFIESYAALRDRVEQGELIVGARLMSFYAAGRRAGHTVLTYETPRGAFVLDPSAAAKPRRIDRKQVNDPMAIARMLVPGVPIVQARWVPRLRHLELPLLAKAEAEKAGALGSERVNGG